MPSPITARLLETTDWSRTPLGPRAGWPATLRLAVSICQGSRFPMFVWWGPELINIYNDAYIPILGKRHPAAFGRAARGIWGEIWPVVGPQADIVMTQGEATWNDRVLLVMERQGYTEETYFTWSYSPIRDESGRVAGLFCACKEDTDSVLAERARDALLAQAESERARLTDAFAQSPAFLALLRGPDHVFEFVNDRYRQLIGNREVKGKGVRKALPELEGQGFFEILDDVFASGRPYVGTGMNVRMARPGQEAPEEIFLDFVYQPMRNADGSVAGILFHGVDVTETRRAEDALESEKQVLEMIATGRAAPDVLDTIVRGVEAQTTDEMICSILVLDETGTRLVHGAAPGLPDAYNRAIHGVAIGPAAGSCGTAAFQRRPVFVSDIAHDPLWADYRALAAEHGLGACHSTPILSSEGAVLGTVAMYYRRPRTPSDHDRGLIRSATHLAGIVLEKDRVDQRLRQSLEAEQAARVEVERASRMKDEFLATLSHELRTPLNAILGWTRILTLKPGVPADIRQGMDVIERNARAQATIIQDLLDMSAIISGKVRLDARPLDLATLAYSAIETATPAAQAKQIALAVAMDAPGEPLMVVGDVSRLQQVLWNLLSNAVKFTPRGGRIDVRVTRDGLHGEVRVSDSGAGIDPEFLPYVFDRFRQADASTTRRHGGMGLGLSIVKQLVELHGGTIHAASEGPGRGATFVVSLPLAATTGTSDSSDDAAVAGLRVLVVDDDDDAREMVRRLLEDRRSVVTTAATAGEALKLLGEKRFDVLVSDIGMPGEDGHTFMRRVRALDAGAGGDIPAVALTAYARAEDRAKALSAGFQLHVAKPVDPGELFTQVASVARRP